MTILEEDLLRIAGDINKLEIKEKTFFVTGANGLIGSFLIKALLGANERFALNNRVVGLVRNRKKAETIFENNKNLLLVTGDVLNPILCDQEIDYIIHAAGETKSRNMIEHPVETLWVTLQGTKNLLDFARKKEVKKFVYLSSMEVFGNVGYSNIKVTEDQLGYLDLRNIRSCYSESKRMAENMCVCYYKEYSVPIVVARLAQTFGAGVSKDDNRVFAQFAKSALLGEDIVLHTTGESYGNYVYTADASNAIFILLKMGCDGEVYTVVNEKSTMTIRSMADMVANTIAKGNIRVNCKIPKSDIYGYAPNVTLKLSGEKMMALGWIPEIDLTESYSRLIQDWKERYDISDSTCV